MNENAFCWILATWMCKISVLKVQLHHKVSIIKMWPGLLKGRYVFVTVMFAATFLICSNFMLTALLKIDKTYLNLILIPLISKQKLCV